MFWKNFLILCNDKKKTPNGVCAELGLSVATATKWKKGAVPRDSTLMRIADYFGVTAESLLADRAPTKPMEFDLQRFAGSPEKEKAPLGSRREEQAPPLLTPEEVQIAVAFHNARPEIQFAIKTMLGIDTSESQSKTDIV